MALGWRISSTIDSISPRQTATEPQTLSAHSPAGHGLALVVVAPDEGDDA